MYVSPGFNHWQFYILPSQSTVWFLWFLQKQLWFLYTALTEWSFNGRKVFSVGYTLKTRRGNVKTRPFIVEVRVRSLVSPCDICRGQSGTGMGFPLSTSVIPVSFNPSVPHTHLKMHATCYRSTNKWSLGELDRKVTFFILLSCNKSQKGLDDETDCLL